MKLVVLQDGHPRAQRIADSLIEGGKAMGWDVKVTQHGHGEPLGDMIAGYGWRNRATFESYRKAGCHYLYVDLGYWQRKKARSDYGGFHKIVLDAQHATEYFRRSRAHDRLDGSPPIQNWRIGGRRIILAGLSPKSAATSGREYLEFETRMIAAIRALTDREIVYRPKPSDSTAVPITGTTFSGKDETIEDVLDSAYGLVTLHSNTGLDALAFGVPIFALEGLASVMSCETLEELIRAPRQVSVDDRQQLLADVSYCHWRRVEVASGKVFNQFIADGLIKP